MAGVMTFPSKNVAALHPSLPRRPSRTTQPRRRSEDHVVYSEVPLVTPGLTRRITRSNVAIQIGVFRDDEHKGRFLFVRGHETEALEKALDEAEASTDILPKTIVAAIQLKSGAALELGAARGLVAIRWVLPSGKRRHASLLRGQELTALRRAIADLKMTAATAALATKETNQ